MFSSSRNSKGRRLLPLRDLSISRRSREPSRRQKLRSPGRSRSRSHSRSPSPRSKKSVKMSCSYKSGEGYCCTSPAMEGMRFCSDHEMIDRVDQFESIDGYSTPAASGSSYNTYDDYDIKMPPEAVSALQSMGGWHLATAAYEIDPLLSLRLTPLQPTSPAPAPVSAAAAVPTMPSSTGTAPTPAPAPTTSGAAAAAAPPPKSALYPVLPPTDAGIAISAPAKAAAAPPSAPAASSGSITATVTIDSSDPTRGPTTITVPVSVGGSASVTATVDTSSSSGGVAVIADGAFLASVQRAFPGLNESQCQQVVANTKDIMQGVFKYDANFDTTDGDLYTVVGKMPASMLGIDADEAVYGYRTDLGVKTVMWQKETQDELMKLFGLDFLHLYLRMRREVISADPSSIRPIEPLFRRLIEAYGIYNDEFAQSYPVSVLSTPAVISILTSPSHWQKNPATGGYVLKLPTDSIKIIAWSNYYRVYIPTEVAPGMKNWCDSSYLPPTSVQADIEIPTAAGIEYNKKHIRVYKKICAAASIGQGMAMSRDAAAAATSKSAAAAAVVDPLFSSQIGSLNVDFDPTEGADPKRISLAGNPIPLSDPDDGNTFKDIMGFNETKGDPATTINALKGKWALTVHQEKTVGTRGYDTKSVDLLLCNEGSSDSKFYARVGTHVRILPPNVAMFRSYLKEPRWYPPVSIRPRVHLIHGLDNANIWNLQADPAFAGATFQVASNFNSLEQYKNDVYPQDVPLAEYQNDKSQGPMAALGATPASIYRMYRWGGGYPTKDHDDDKYKIYPGMMIYEPSDLYKAGVRVTAGGWLGVNSADKPTSVSGGGEVDYNSSLFTAPDTNWEDRIGMASVGVYRCEVTHGFNKSSGYFRLQSPNIVNQVFCATIDMDPTRGVSQKVQESLLRKWQIVCQFSAYLNTLIFAAKAGSKVVFLTLIGGGVFANDPEIICTQMFNAIHAFTLGYTEEAKGMSINIVLYGDQDAKMMAALAPMLDKYNTTPASTSSVPAPPTIKVKRSRILKSVINTVKSQVHTEMAWKSTRRLPEDATSLKEDISAAEKKIADMSKSNSIKEADKKFYEGQLAGIGQMQNLLSQAQEMQIKAWIAIRMGRAMSREVSGEVYANVNGMISSMQQAADKVSTVTAGMTDRKKRTAERMKRKVKYFQDRLAAVRSSRGVRAITSAVGSLFSRFSMLGGRLVDSVDNRLENNLESTGKLSDDEQEAEDDAIDDIVPADDEESLVVPGGATKPDRESIARRVLSYSGILMAGRPLSWAIGGVGQVAKIALKTPGYIKRAYTHTGLSDSNERLKHINKLRGLTNEAAEVTTLRYGSIITNTPAVSKYAVLPSGENAAAAADNILSGMGGGWGPGTFEAIQHNVYTWTVDQKAPPMPVMISSMLKSLPGLNVGVIVECDDANGFIPSDSCMDSKVLQLSAGPDVKMTQMAMYANMEKYLESLVNLRYINRKGGKTSKANETDGARWGAPAVYAMTANAQATRLERYRVDPAFAPAIQSGVAAYLDVMPDAMQSDRSKEHTVSDDWHNYNAINSMLDIYIVTKTPPGASYSEERANTHMTAIKVATALGSSVIIDPTNDPEFIKALLSIMAAGKTTAHVCDLKEWSRAPILLPLYQNKPCHGDVGQGEFTAEDIPDAAKSLGCVMKSDGYEAVLAAAEKLAAADTAPVAAALPPVPAPDKMGLFDRALVELATEQFNREFDMHNLAYLKYKTPQDRKSSSWSDDGATSRVLDLFNVPYGSLPTAFPKFPAASVFEESDPIITESPTALNPLVLAMSDMQTQWKFGNGGGAPPLSTKEIAVAIEGGITSGFVAFTSDEYGRVADCETTIVKFGDASDITPLVTAKTRQEVYSYLNPLYDTITSETTLQPGRWSAYLLDSVIAEHAVAIEHMAKTDPASNTLSKRCLVLRGARLTRIANMDRNVLVTGYGLDTVPVNVGLAWSVKGDMDSTVRNAASAIMGLMFSTVESMVNVPGPLSSLSNHIRMPYPVWVITSKRQDEFLKKLRTYTLRDLGFTDLMPGCDMMTIETLLRNHGVPLTVYRETYGFTRSFDASDIRMPSAPPAEPAPATILAAPKVAPAASVPSTSTGVMTSPAPAILPSAPEGPAAAAASAPEIDTSKTPALAPISIIPASSGPPPAIVSTAAAPVPADVTVPGSFAPSAPPEPATGTAPGSFAPSAPPPEPAPAAPAPSAPPAPAAEEEEEAKPKSGFFASLRPLKHVAVPKPKPLLYPELPDVDSAAETTPASP